MKKVYFAAAQRPWLSSCIIVPKGRYWQLVSFLSFTVYKCSWKKVLWIVAQLTCACGGCWESLTQNAQKSVSSLGQKFVWGRMR